MGCANLCEFESNSFIFNSNIQKICWIYVMLTNSITFYHPYLQPSITLFENEGKGKNVSFSTKIIIINSCIFFTLPTIYNFQTLFRAIVYRC